MGGGWGGGRGEGVWGLGLGGLGLGFGSCVLSPGAFGRPSGRDGLDLHLCALRSPDDRRAASTKTALAPKPSKPQPLNPKP